MRYTSLQYFYHADHLGSASWITDADGNGYQHLQYLPPDSYRDGENWVEQRLGSYNTPYQFSGKEKDEETGYNYFGARYYDSDLSVWLSVDPMSDRQPYLTAYHFVRNSSIVRIDPNGLWDIEVHAYKDRSKSGYAVLILKDNEGNEVYRTVIKTTGAGGRNREKANSDTPQGNYRIIEWRKTGNGRYNRESFGPNDLLALDYAGGEGGRRQGMHLHGGRQEGKYRTRKGLADTHGCMRINDKDIKEIKEITTQLELNDPTERPGNLTLTDDLRDPTSYNQFRHYAGAGQFPMVKPISPPNPAQVDHTDVIMSPPKPL
jgi:RHS repeat-associated protein